MLSFFKLVTAGLLTFVTLSFAQDVTLTIDGTSLNYESTADIYGFQFDHDGCAIGSSGGDAEANGFTISASSGVVLAFSFSGAFISAGSGTLLDMGGECATISDLVFSGGTDVTLVGELSDGGETCPISECGPGMHLMDGDSADCYCMLDCEHTGDCVSGCLDSEACNYNGAAELDDGSCEYLDCFDDCGGSAVLDVCGVCDGDGIADGECDCGGNVEDDCGVCGGDGNCVGDDSIELSFGAIVDGDGTMEIIMNNTIPITGFQFNVTGTDLSGAFGGRAVAAGFSVSTGVEGMVLGFSFAGAAIPAGSGVLTNLNFTALADQACLADEIIAIGDFSGFYEIIIGDCAALDYTVPSSTADVLYSSDSDIAGFQFHVDGDLTVIGASGGAAADAGFAVSVGNSTNNVIGFSFAGGFIPAGSGTLIALEYTGSGSPCLSNLVLSDTDAGGLAATVEDCLTISYEAPCDDVDDDGICDDVDDCVGALDDCGVCNGGNANNLGCGCGEAAPVCGVCDGSIVDVGCGCGNPAASDDNHNCDDTCGGVNNATDAGCGCGVYDQLPTDGCDDTCGSILEFDNCGVCDGDGSTCGVNQPDWVDCPSCYENTASMTAIVRDALSEEQMGGAGDILAAFDDAGNNRGIALQLGTSVPCMGDDGIVYNDDPDSDNYVPFPGDGSVDCAGVPFGPNVGTILYEIQIRGDETGDAISFKYYDASADEVLDSGTGYTFVIDDIIGNVVMPHEISVGAITLSINIASGWNWFSLNVEGDMGIGSVMASLTPTEGDFIKSASASATYYPDFGWYGGLDELGVTGMYKFNSANADLLVFSGAPVDPASTPITLASGWNWLGFTPQNDGPTADALATITTTEGDFIKNQGASSTYYPDFGWYGGLDVMAPTEGYMLSVAEGSVLTYPNFDAADALTRAKVEKELPVAVSDWEVDYHDYEFNGHITMSIDSREDSHGDYIAVFAGDECRGLAERMYFPFGDSYMYSVMVYSNKTDGEAFTFKYYDSAIGEIVEYAEAIDFTSDMIVGDGFNTFGLSREGSDLQQPIAYGISDAYPNPFNPVTSFEYTLEKDGMVQVAVYDINGRMVSELVNGYQSAGSYPVVWDAQDLSSGIYMVNMIAGDYSTKQKVMLIK